MMRRRARSAEPAHDERPMIGEMLVARGLVSKADVAEALDRQRTTGRRLGETLFEIGAISSFDLAQVLAERQNVPFLDLRDVAPEPAAVAHVDEDLARQYLMLPVRVTDGCLHLAMANPSDVYALDDVGAATGLAVEAAMADPGQLLEALDRAYGHDAPPPGAAPHAEGDAEPEAPLDGPAPATPRRAPTAARRSSPEAARRQLEALERRMDLAAAMAGDEARAAWSIPARELLEDAHLAAFRNVALFLADLDAEPGAMSCGVAWPPADPVVANAVDRLRAQAAWLDRRLRGAPPHAPDVVVSAARFDEMLRDLARVLAAFHRALDNGPVADAVADAQAAPAGAPETVVADADRAPEPQPARPTAPPPRPAGTSVGLGIFAELRAQ